MIKHSIEWNEMVGDAMDEVLEQMADEQELTAADLDDWYAQLLPKDNA